MTNPIPLNACAMVSLIEASLGSPRTTIYGLATTSNSDNPQAITKVAPTNAPNFKNFAAGQNINAPTTKNPNPNIIPGLYPHLRMNGPPIRGGKTKYAPNVAI